MVAELLDLPALMAGKGRRTLNDLLKCLPSSFLVRVTCFCITAPSLDSECGRPPDHSGDRFAAGSQVGIVG
jgi:hypothetical protein